LAFILLSGHADDFYHYLCGDDYGWLTEQLVGLMDKATTEPAGGSGGGSSSSGSGGSRCGVRVVSVLEGGYSLAPLVDTKDVKDGDKANQGHKQANTRHADKQHGAGHQHGAATSKDKGAMKDAAKDRGNAARAKDGGLAKGVAAHVRALAGL
jgi:hypothetical protein